MKFTLNPSKAYSAVYLPDLRTSMLLVGVGLFGCDFDPVAPALPQTDSTASELSAASAVSYGGYSYPRDLAFRSAGPIALNDHGLVVGVDYWGHFVRSDGGVLSFYPGADEGWSTVEDVNNGGVALVHTGYYGASAELLWPNGVRTSVKSENAAFHEIDYDWFGPPATAINNYYTVVGIGSSRTSSGIRYGALRRHLNGTVQTVRRLTPPLNASWLRAVDVNDANVAVGWSIDYYSPLDKADVRGFLWLANDMVFPLDPPRSFGTEFIPTTITNGGVVYGTTDNPTFGTQVASWSWNTGWRHLLYRHPLCNLKASEKGRLIYDDCAGSAFTWYGGVETRLPLSRGGPSAADDVNTCGVIAGRAATRAVLWVRRRCD